MAMTNEEITRYAFDPKRRQLIDDLTQEIGPFDASGLKSFDEVGQFGLSKMLPKAEAPRNPGVALDMYLRGRRQGRDAARPGGSGSMDAAPDWLEKLLSS
jgi:hypothetical protein